MTFITCIRIGIIGRQKQIYVQLPLFIKNIIEIYVKSKNTIDFETTNPKHIQCMGHGLYIFIFRIYGA